MSSVEERSFSPEEKLVVEYFSLLDNVHCMLMSLINGYGVMLIVKVRRYAYSAMMKNRDCNTSPFCAVIWNKLVPLKVSLFAWRFSFDYTLNQWRNKPLGSWVFRCHCCLTLNVTARLDGA